MRSKRATPGRDKRSRRAVGKRGPRAGKGEDPDFATFIGTLRGRISSAAAHAATNEDEFAAERWEEFEWQRGGQRVRNDILAILGDNSVPPTLRRRVAKAAESLPWIGLLPDPKESKRIPEERNALTEDERKVQMDAILETFELTRYADVRTDRLFGKPPLLPPKPGLPVPDDTPFARALRRRVRK